MLYIVSFGSSRKKRLLKEMLGKLEEITDYRPLKTCENGYIVQTSVHEDEFLFALEKAYVSVYGDDKDIKIKTHRISKSDVIFMGEDETVTTWLSDQMIEEGLLDQDLQHAPQRGIQFEDIFVRDTEIQEFTKIQTIINFRRAQQLIIPTTHTDFSNILIWGGTGTGKSIFAKAALNQLKLQDKTLASIATDCTYVRNNYAHAGLLNFSKTLSDAGTTKSVLILDNLEDLFKMSAEGKADPFIDLYASCSLYSGNTQIIATYRGTDIPEVLSQNKDIARLFPHQIKLEDYSLEDVVQLFSYKAACMGANITDTALYEVVQYVSAALEDKSQPFQNGWLAQDMMTQASDQWIRRTLKKNISDVDSAQEGDFLIQGEDIPRYIPKHKKFSQPSIVERKHVVQRKKSKVIQLFKNEK